MDKEKNFVRFIFFDPCRARRENQSSWSHALHNRKGRNYYLFFLFCPFGEAQGSMQLRGKDVEEDTQDAHTLSQTHTAKVQEV